MSGVARYTIESLVVTAGVPAPGIAPGPAARFAAAQALLERCGLPRLVPEDRPGEYLLCRDGDAVVACGGWERYGADALLRSVAVAPECRGQRLGECLVIEALARLRAAGAADVWLLTETAAPFFARLGFRAGPREAASEAVRASRQFAGACCASAACLRLVLTPPHPGEDDHP